MLFTRKASASPAKVLRLVATQEWRQGETLRITPRPREQANPGAKRLVIRRDDLGGLTLTPMRWGLRNEHDCQFGQTRPLTTVRTEGLRTHAEWRRLLNAQRCLVPAEQFFEWKRVGDVRTREFCLKLKSQKPMMIAGLWSRTDGFGDTFAYISCRSNPLFALVHEQMPVILDQAAIATWFNPDATLESLMSFLRPARVEDIEVHAVTKPKTAQRPTQPSLFDRQAA
ncbi:MAG: SOS response-associated peptidase family protein [Micropepsaceae bacterium]